MASLRIMVSRHSAFYTPLIGTIAAGFLEREGIRGEYSVLPAGGRSHELIAGGDVDVMQSAVASNFGPLDRGIAGLPVHFAQINRRDGFFLVARRRERGFEWRSLEDRELLADHGLQPLVMLRYAVHCRGAAWGRVRAVDAGTPEEMTAAFRNGRGDFVHLQSPAAHQLEEEGAGVVVASVGEAMPEVAFSSLCASRSFLETEAAGAFTRAFRQSRAWAREADPAAIAEAEAPYFPDFTRPALEAAVRAYQKLGCWEGGLEIPRELYEQAFAVFEHAGAVRHRHAYEEVVGGLPA